jgi:hypothetical protein
MEPGCGTILGITAVVLIAVIVFARMTSEKTAITVVFSIMAVAGIGLYIAGEIKSRKNPPVATSPVPTPTQPTQPAQTISKPADYESDLTERCKDWIYYRNKAYKLGREGDQEGSEKARIAMLTFDRDLHKKFTEQQISDEISRLEASGR